jgi:hypothetical protein
VTAVGDELVVFVGVTNECDVMYMHMVCMTFVGTPVLCVCVA